MATPMSNGKWLATREGSAGTTMRICDTEEEAIKWESR